MPGRFLDTNILLRYLTRDDETKAGSAFALLGRIENGDENRLPSSSRALERTLGALLELLHLRSGSRRPMTVAMVWRKVI